MKRALAVIGITVAAALTPLAGTAQQPESGGWRTFANCFAHTAPGAQPMCAATGVNRDPTTRLRYAITGANGVTEIFVAESIRCYTGTGGPARGRNRDYTIDAGKGQHVVAFAPFRVDTNGDGVVTAADNRARRCAVTVTAWSPHDYGDISVFFEARTP